MEIKKEKVKIDKNNPSLQRIDSRCIDCGMCKRVCENIVGLDHTYEKKNNPLCIHCGQCILNCPVGALCTKYDYKKVLNLVNDSNKRVAISVAPAVRASLGSEFGIEGNMENIIPSILRKLGFDYVFDVTFGADVTIMEEASELIERLKHKENLPMFTSCCPSWVKYASMFHPELIPNLSTTKSPIGIQSSLIKTYFKELNNIEDEIISVVVAPCTAKKYEIKDMDTDYIITTNELAMMIRECEIEFDALKPSSFDALLGKGSKAGLMFGRSGGVMESALNCAYYLINKKNPPKDYFHLDIKEGLTKGSYKLGSKTISIAVIYGMKNVEEFLPELVDYDFVEVMNCPGGCIGGGGQPLGTIQGQSDERIKRTNILNSDENKYLYCFQNPEIKDLYKFYLEKPLSEKSLKITHTTHKDLSNLIKKLQTRK
jgi:ferredoxin hydrogenase